MVLRWRGASNHTNTCSTLISEADDVGDAGAVALAQSLTCLTHLQHLSVESNVIGEQGEVAVA